MAITNIPGWSDGLSDNVAKTPLQVYKRVPLAFKCANLVASAVSTAPTYIYRNDDESEWMYNTSLKSLLKRVAKDLQLYGKSFVLKLTNKNRQVQNLRRLNPNGMNFRVIGIENGEPLFSFTQTYNHMGRTLTKQYDHHEVIYIRVDSENNDVDPDIYPLKVAFQSGKVLDYLATFGEYYFEAGAMPTTAIGIPEGTSPEEKNAFEKWVKRRVSGIRKAFGIIALRGEIHAVQLNPPAKDLAIPELDELNRKRVMDAFGVPEGMIEKSANFASAKVHNKQFWDMTAKPLTELIVDAFNDQLFDDSGYEIRLAFEELSIYQEDENKRSAALRNLVSAGVSLDAAWYTLGFADLPDDMPLSVPALPAPEEKADGKPEDIGVGRNDHQPETIKGVANVPSMFTQLDRWKNKSINRIRQGKSLIFDFESEYIPMTLMASIEGALSEANTADDIRHIFSGAVDLSHSHSEAH